MANESRLTQTKREQVKRDLFLDNDEAGALEKIRAHFESHPTMPGEKDFKKQVNKLLDSSEPVQLTETEKDDFARRYAETEVRETKFNGSVVNVLKSTATDPETGKTKREYKDPEQNKFKLSQLDDTAYSLDAELRRMKDGVYIYAKTNPDAARFTRVGKVPDNFLANNPMNVDRCPAQISIEDYSNGRLRNVSERLVVESSRMSGDYVELTDDMIIGLEKPAGLEQ